MAERDLTEVVTLGDTLTVAVFDVLGVRLVLGDLVAVMVRVTLGVREGDIVRVCEALALTEGDIESDGDPTTGRLL